MKLIEWIKKHKIIVALIAAAIIMGIPLLIHILFKLHAPYPFLQAEWTAGEFLGYYGAVLSFLGTAAISLVVVFLGNHLSEQSRQQQEKREAEAKALQEKRHEDERKLQELRLAEQRKADIQPIFLVEIVSLDTMPDGTAEPFSLNDLRTLPKHKNIKIRIKNVGQHPILHVIVFDKYKKQLMEPNGEITVHCAYYDSPDAKGYRDKFILLTDDYERDDAGRPMWFNINYQDIDGNSMFQTFVLSNFDGTVYYQREATEET